MPCGIAGLAAPKDRNRSSGLRFKAGNKPDKNFVGALVVGLVVILQYFSQGLKRILNHL